MVILDREEIDDLETFLQLDEKDFARLNFTTKQIKIIQRMQLQYRIVTVEWLNDQQTQDATHVHQESTPQPQPVPVPGPSNVSSPPSELQPSSSTAATKNALSGPSKAPPSSAADKSYQEISLENVRLSERLKSSFY